MRPYLTRIWRRVARVVNHDACVGDAIQATMVAGGVAMRWWVFAGLGFVLWMRRIAQETRHEAH